MFRMRQLGKKAGSKQPFLPLGDRFLPFGAFVHREGLEQLRLDEVPSKMTAKLSGFPG